MNSKEIFDFIIKIHAISHIGLEYSKDAYAISNYKEIEELSLKMLEDLQGVKIEENDYFSKVKYPTPNVSTRAFVTNEKDELLFVKEANSGLYSLPGGWCDLYDKPSEACINEVRQEAGYNFVPEKVLAVLDRTPFKSDTSTPEYLIVFQGKIEGEKFNHEYETTDVKFFSLDKLPNLSKKVSPFEMDRIINAYKNKEQIFD